MDNNLPLQFKPFLKNRFPVTFDGINTKKVYAYLKKAGKHLDKNDKNYLGIVLSGSRTKGFCTEDSDADITVLVKKNTSKDEAANLIEELLLGLNSETGIRTIIQDLKNGILGENNKKNYKSFLGEKIAVRLDPNLVLERFQKIDSDDFLTILDGRYSLLTSFGNIVHSSANYQNDILSYQQKVKSEFKKQKQQIKDKFINGYNDLFVGIIQPLNGLDKNYRSDHTRLVQRGLSHDQALKLIEHRKSKFSIFNYHKF